MKSKRIPFCTFATTTLVMAFSAASLVHAASISWNGATSTAWATPTNWTGGIAPAATDIAVFSLATYPNQPNAGTTSVAGLQIGDGTTITGALALSGTSLTLGNSGISMLANAGAATISSPLVLGAAQSWSNTSGSVLSISGAVTRNVGTTVNFVPTGTINLGAGSGLANDASGILGGWATVGNAGTAGSSGDWAALDGSGNVITYAGYTNITTNMGAGSYSAQNWKNSVANVALTASATVNSLVVTQDFSVSSGATMTLGSGGLIVSGPSRWFKNNGAGSTAGTGQLTSGLGSGELFIDSSGSATTDNDWRIWTKIVDNGGTAVKLVKNGPGYLRLANSNTYTGGTIVNGGALVGDGGSAFGTGAVQVNSGAVTVNLNAGTMANNFTVATGTSVTVDNATNNGTLNGSFSGGGTVTIQNTSGGANLSENVNGSWSGFTGTLNYNTSNRVVNIFSAAGMDLSNAAVNFANSGNLTNSSFRTSATETTKLGSLAGFGYLWTNGATEIGNLGTSTTFSGVISQAGGITKVGNGTLTLSGANTHTGTTAVNGGTLQIGNGTSGSIANTSAVTVGASGTLALKFPAATTTFANNITNGGTVTTLGGNSLTLSALNGAGSLLKADAGTLTLSGAGTFSGNSNVSAGKLQVNSYLPDSSVTLGAATLGGNGTVGAVTVNNPGAVIANGNGASETLNLGSLTFTTGATLNLNKVNDTDTPALAVMGNLDTVSGLAVNLTTSPIWNQGTYNLISYDSYSDYSPTLPHAPHLIKGTIPGLSGRQTATLGSTGAGAGYITLTITGDTPVWSGAGSQTWKTVATNDNTGPNAWARKDAHTVTNFWVNDAVEFNDTYNLGAGDVPVANSTVTIQGGVAPVSTAFNNSLVNYTVKSSDSTGITSGALSKSGDGTVTLTTTNSYTGATSIIGGTLQLGDGTTDGDIASSSSIANDGTLIWNRSSGTFTYGNVISGYGEVIKNGAGTQILAGANTRTGLTTINSGTLQVGNADLTGSLGSGSVTNNASLVFNRSNAVTQGTDFGGIDGTGSVTQAGSGTLTLSLANTYSGGTTVNSGTTIAAAGGSAFGTGAVTVNGGTLTNSGDAGVSNTVVVGAGGASIRIGVDQNFNFNGTLSGAGNVNLASTAFVKSLNWNFTANTMTSGTITMAAGGNNTTVLRLNSPNATSAALDWVLNGAADRGIPIGAEGVYHFGSLAGSGILQGNFQPASTLITLSLGGNDHSADFAGSIRNNGPTVSVVKVGTGTQTLSGANTYTGDTTVNGGILAVDGGSIVDTNKLVISGGKVDPMGGTEVVGTLYFGATQQAAGTWGATGSTATHIDDVHFTGTGVVSVTTGPAGYTSWADANGATGQTMDQDHDNDGVDNGIEYFMGQTGSSFTANPAPVSGAVTWPMGASYTGVYGTDYEIQTSGNLVTWTQAPQGSGAGFVTVNAGVSVAYTLPTGGGKVFVRLVVKN